jgi:hypothetical protein
MRNTLSRLASNDLFDGVLPMALPKQEANRLFEGEANKPPLKQSKHEHEPGVNPRPSLKVCRKQQRCQKVYDKQPHRSWKVEQDQNSQRPRLVPGAKRPSGNWNSVTTQVEVLPALSCKHWSLSERISSKEQMRHNERCSDATTEK